MMKMDVRLVAALAFTTLLPMYAVAGIATTTAVGTDSGPRLIEKGLNHRVWEKVKSQTLASGRVITRKECLTEIGTGMYFEDANGQLVESRELVELADGGGAVARHGQHQIFFSPNANTAGSI